jgi:site-specific recombinase XerD
MSTTQAANTLRAYRADWKDFQSWCSAHRREALPATPATLTTYLADLAADAKLATLRRRLVAISQMHKNCGYRSPTSMQHSDVKATLSRISRAQGTAPIGKTALLTAEMRRLVGVLPDTVLGARDAALLLLGFASGLRRAELAALRAEHIDLMEHGLRIALNRFRSQGSPGRSLEIPYATHPDLCPVRAYMRWLAVSGITVGPVFRYVNKGGQVGANAITPQTVCLVVKRRCGQADLDPAQFGANSLRSGLATQAALNGVSISSIMKQTGHRSVAACRHCIRDAQLSRENAAAKLDL